MQKKKEVQIKSVPDLSMDTRSHFIADDDDRYLDNVEQYYEEVAQDGSFKEFRRTGVYAFRIEVPENTEKVLHHL